MRRTALLLTVSALVFSVAAPARATGPVITEVSQVFTNASYFPPGVTCPGGFTVRIDAVSNRRQLSFYDESGRLVLEKRHIDFSGTVRNSVTGYSLPYAGHWNRTFDPVGGTIKQTGLERHTVVPGIGTVSLSAGIRILDAATREEEFVAGPHEFDAQLCGLLAP